MIDDILAGIFGEVVLGRLSPSRRVLLLTRVFFGLLGAGLSAAGAVHFLGQPNLTANTAMWACMIGVFVFLGCFCLFNVALARAWRWPGLLFVASFVGLFVTRIAFGR
jgi:hypothetical protein